MRAVTAAGLALLVGAFAPGGEAAPGPAFERALHVASPGLVAVRMDRHVYEAARPDLGDLRVIDAQGEPVPYVLDRGGASGPLSEASGESLGERQETLVPRWSRAEEPETRETWLTLDLGARHQPFLGVVLEVEDERFSREVRLDVREEPPLSRTDTVAPRERWRGVGQGVVYRLEEGGNRREHLGVEATGRARVLRLRLQNHDDRPLRIEGVRVRAPVEWLLLEAEREGDLVLTYGVPGLAAPEYDLVRTLSADSPIPLAALGPPVRRDVVADVLPWSERHPVLLWVGLLAVVAALGAVTWRALRSA